LRVLRAVRAAAISKEVYFDLRRQDPACETGPMTVTVAVLAGGLGRRIGGEKAIVDLARRPLISYPLAAANAAGLDAVVVAKRHTRLPDLEVPILLEPDEPTHPLVGVVTALERFQTILAIPCDMPFLSANDLAALAAMPTGVATLTPNQPFPSLYRRVSLPQLREAIQAGASVRSTLAHFSHAPAAIASTRQAQFTVNTPDDLAEAERQLATPGSG
jgi:molybdenum cofactor guanylyltransferase